MSSANNTSTSTPQLDNDGFTVVQKRAPKKPSPNNKPVEAPKQAPKQALKPSKPKKAWKSAPVPRMVPIDQPVVPFEAFKVLSPECRKALASGPSVAVYSRGNLAIHVPKRLIMAVSPLANAHFSKDQTNPMLPLEGDGNPKEAVVTVVEYLVKVCKSEKFILLPWKDVKKTAAIYQVGRTLGMGCFFRHLENYLVNRIVTEKGLIEYGDLESVLNRTNNDINDPLFKRYAHALCTLRYKRQIPDPEDFEAWLTKHRELSQLMADIDAQHEAKRQKIQAEKQAHKQAEKQTKKQPKPATSRALQPGEYHIGAEAARKLNKKGFM
jgi:hypothetical protein